MGYQEVAAKQHGFLLPCQLTKQELQEAQETGFIIDPEWESYTSPYVFYTTLYEPYTLDNYLGWLVAFPTIPPEERFPTPYFAGTEALRIHNFVSLRSDEPSIMITPPALMPHINEKYGLTYVMNENITPDDWMLVDDTPVENILPAMRKFFAHVYDFDDALDTAFSAYHRGYSWDEIAWALEPAVDKWASYETGKIPTNGKEVLELFFEERIPAPRPADNESIE